MHGVKEVPLHEFTNYLTPDSIRAFCLGMRFRLDRAMLVVFGDVDPLVVEDELGAALDKMTIVLRDDPIPNQSINAGAIKATWDVASHQFFMAWPAPPPSDPAHPALSLLAQLLQQRLGFSPVIAKLRRQPLLVYSDLSGLFVIQSPLKSKDDGDALAVEVRKAIDVLAADEGALRALKNARADLRASAGILPGPMQYPPTLPRKIVAHTNLEIARMRATFAWDQSPEDYCARADKVTGPEIQAAMKTWLAPEKAAIVTIVGKE
jgi:predicted Zn-dependent peptidase